MSREHPVRHVVPPGTCAAQRRRAVLPKSPNHHGTLRTRGGWSAYRGAWHRVFRMGRFDCGCRQCRGGICSCTSKLHNPGRPAIVSLATAAGVWSVTVSAQPPANQVAGHWLIEGTPSPGSPQSPFVNVATLTDDGQVVNVDPDVGTSVGGWRRIRGREAYDQSLQPAQLVDQVVRHPQLERFVALAGRQWRERQDRLHVGDERVPDARCRPDEAGMAGIVVERLPQFLDTPGQHAVGDDGARQSSANSSCLGMTRPGCRTK